MTAPTLVGTEVSTGNVTTRSVTPSSTIPAGAVVIVTAHAGGASIDLSCADAQGNTWTAQAAVSVATTPSTTRTFTCKVTTPITGAITVTRGTSGGLAIIVATLPDTYSATPVDTDSGSNATAQTTHLAPAVTVPDGGGVVILASTTNVSRTYSAGVGTLLTQVASSGTGNPRVGGFCYVDTATAGDVQPTLIASAGNTFSASAMVLVEDGGDPEPPPDPVAGSVAIIGDSLTFRADSGSTNSRETTTRARLADAGYDPDLIYWHGVGGKRMLVADSGGDTTLENLAEAVAALEGPPAQLVIALGTNDVSLSTSDFGDAVDTILDACEAAGVGHVYWVGLAYWSPANTNAATYNPVIAARVGARDAATYLDVNAHMGNPRDAADWIYPTDSTHLTTQGYAKRDAFIISALTDTRHATATGDLVWTGAASAVTARVGAASGSTAWTGAATGVTERRATTTGQAAWAGGASGARSPVATTAGATAWTGTAAGLRHPKATAAGAVQWAGTAQGFAPDPDESRAYATGTTTWTGTATGTRAPVATTTGQLAWAGAAVGHAPDPEAATATATGTLAWAGTAVAVRASLATASGVTAWAGTAVQPAGRDITLTLGPLTLHPMRVTSLTAHPMRVTALEV